MLDAAVLNSAEIVSDSQFLTAIFGADTPWCHVTDFTFDPSNIPKDKHLIAWHGDYYSRYQFSPNTNRYFTISTFYADDQSVARRRKALYRQTHCFVLDDVREKLNEEAAKKLPRPSWILETSAGSFQWGYIFNTPVTEASKIDNLNDGLIASELAPSGKDPGQRGTTRYVRLPEGSNSKASKLVNGQPFKCQLTLWEPFNRVTIEQLAEPFAVDLDRVRRESRIDGAAAVSDHPLINIPEIIHIKEVRSDGRFDITCPFVNEHTGQDDSGSAVFTNADGSIGYKCHHGSCQERTGKDLLQYIELKEPGFGSRLKTWQVTRNFATVNEPSFLTPIAEQQALVAEPDFNSTVGMDCDVDLSHAELALQLGEKWFYANARYIHTWGKWLLWDGHRWLLDTRLHHMSLTGKYLTVKGNELTAWAAALPEKTDEEAKKKTAAVIWAKREAVGVKSAPMRMNICSMIKTDPRCSVAPEVFDSNLNLIGTSGGTVDLATGVLSTAERGQYITKSLSFALVDGQPELWLKFLDEIMAGDQNVVNFLQRLCGYALTGETVEQKLFFLYGTGSNGKSVFLDMLFHIFGDYGRKAPANLFLEQKNEQHPTALAGLQGARLAVGSELPAGQTWNESLIKDLTGGDVITARLMRQDFFEYKPQFTLMIAGNHQPKLKNVDEAMSRRMVLIPFNVTIPAEKRDHKLAEKLKAEAGQILSWMIAGAVEYHRSGLAIPESIKAASKSYLDDEDVLAEFLSTCCISDTPGEILFSSLYQIFKNWSKSQGIVFPWTERALRKAIKEKGYTIERSNNKYRLKGMSLTTHPVFF